VTTRVLNHGDINSLKRFKEFIQKTNINDKYVDVTELNELKKNHFSRSLTTEMVIRSKNVVESVKKRANLICECCGKRVDVDNKDNNSVPELQVHHVEPLCRARKEDGTFDNDKLNQLDKISNCIGVCPNCHRRIHLSKKGVLFIKLHNKTTYKGNVIGLREDDE